ncbi:MAG: hypothetical protein OEM52_14860 [bacterium]|nr:hypothetical protein [bacterium]
MSRFTLVTLGLMVTLSLSAFANVLIVDSNTNNSTPYREPQMAHDAASNGDTIYIVGAATTYTGFTATKMLVWIGPGYMLTANPETQANASEARISTTYFNAGSQNSQLIGITVQSSSLQLSANNIVVRRCYFPSSQLIVGNVSDCSILQCFITGVNIAISGSSNTQIYGCYVTASPPISFQGGSTGTTIGNCVLQNNSNGGFILTNSLFFNSFYYSYPYSSSPFSLINSQVDHVLTNRETLCEGVGNQLNISIDSVFNTNLSGERLWTLRTNSLGIGAGRNNTDIGMFAGSYPYVLSGIPPIPTVTYLFIPTSASVSGGLQVDFRAKGRN